MKLAHSMASLALLTLTSMFPALASAQDAGGYVGGSLGQSNFDDGNAIPDLITSGTVHGTDTGYKIFVGYQFNQNFGLEFAYVDLGEASYRGSYFGLSVTGGTVKVSGLNISAVGTLPLNPSFALFGKVGMFSWDAKANDITGGVPFSGKDDGTDLSFGLGASYNINKNVSVRGEWERYQAIGDIDLLSVGLVVKF